MSKVLLAYEDYTEMSQTAALLKRVGFDVLSISSEFALSEQMLNFNPDIVVAFGHGPKVSTLGVGRRLKEMPRWHGKTVLIFPADIEPDPLDLARARMDIALEEPVEITHLLHVLANLTSQDPHVLTERMMKTVAHESHTHRVSGETGKPPDNSSVYVSGGEQTGDASWNVKGNSEADEFSRLMGLPLADPKTTGSIREQMAAASARLTEKMKNYGQFLKDSVADPKRGLKRTEVKKAQKNLADSVSDEQLKSLDEQRREFARSLFKKKD